MADIELVIKIPKRVYDYILKTNNIVNSDRLEVAEAIVNGTPIPDNATICDIEQLKTKIIAMSCRYSIARERGCSGQVEWSDRLIKYEDIIKIFDEYQKGGKE